ILTCTGVSFAHGSNDGQKGMGLIMLILIGILPMSFAVNLGAHPDSIAELAASTQAMAIEMDHRAPGITITESKAAADELSSYLKTKGVGGDRTFAAIATKCREVVALLAGKKRLTELTSDDRRALRSHLYLT